MEKEIQDTDITTGSSSSSAKGIVTSGDIIPSSSSGSSSNSSSASEVGSPMHHDTSSSLQGSLSEPRKAKPPPPLSPNPYLAASSSADLLLGPGPVGTPIATARSDAEPTNATSIDGNEMVEVVSIDVVEDSMPKVGGLEFADDADDGKPSTFSKPRGAFMIQLPSSSSGGGERKKKEAAGSSTSPAFNPHVNNNDDNNNGININTQAPSSSSRERPPRLDDSLLESTQKLLDSLGIVHGLQPNPLNLADVDVDPTLNLLSHIWDCMGALKDVNKRYRKQNSKATVIGSLATFGFQMEIGRLVNNIVTLDAFENDDTGNDVVLSTAVNIFKKFPDVATNRHKESGRALIHHMSQNVPPHIAVDLISIHTNLFPNLTKLRDTKGAVGLHWITVNKRAEPRAVKVLIDSFPAGCATKDVDGLTPLHWAVMRDDPDHDIIKILIKAYPLALSTAANDGSCPIHALLRKEYPPPEIIETLCSSNLKVLQTKDSEGMLPIHRYINRGNTNMDIVNILLDAYPKCTSRTDDRRRTALHIAVDHAEPSEDCVKALILQYQKACELPDLDGYVPLHYVLDGDSCSPDIVRLLITAYPSAVSKATTDGYLPLHCLLCNDAPDLDLLNKLIQLFPQGVQQVAVDLVPTDDQADPLTWTGPLKEKRWTPLSRAIEKGLLPVIKVLQDALPKSSAPNAANQVPGKKHPLSGLKPIRPLPSGFLPPSLRQAAYFAKTLDVGKPHTAKGSRGGDEEEGKEVGGSDRAGDNKKRLSSAPNPSIYFGGREDKIDEETGQDDGNRIDIVVDKHQRDEDIQ